MAAVHHVNRMQMQLFVDPEEHFHNVVGATDQRFDQSREELWHKKEMEARDTDPLTHGAGLYQSIKEEGVRNPIEVIASDDQSGWIQYEGHHRAAASRAVQRDTGRQQWVPIRYHNMSYPSEKQLKAANWRQGGTSGRTT